MIASLSMYDGGELAQANDALWRSIAKGLRARGVQHVPASLTRDAPIDAIYNNRLSGPTRPEAGLLLGQTCGYPFARRLFAEVKIVGVPIYDLPGCEGTLHRSFIVVSASSKARRLGDLAGARAVINEEESNTGRNLLGNSFADIGARFPFFSAIMISGSHRNSLFAVARGEADVAAIDCISHAYLLREDPTLSLTTRVIHQTRPSPTLPFVTARATPLATRQALFEAISASLADPEIEPVRRILGLTGIAPIDPGAYAITREFAARADQVLVSAGAGL